VFPTLCQLTSSLSKVAAFRRQISRSPTIHGPLSHSPVNRPTWDSSRYRSVPDDSWGMNDICHHSGYHGDDDSVAVKAPKPWHKWNYKPNRVSISSHITTIPATLPTFQLSYPRQREEIKRAHRCMPHYTIFHSITCQPISPFVSPYPHMWRDPHHVNFVLQPPINPWSNPSSLQGLQRAHAIDHD
jgi:hypothetical protein